MQLQCNPVAESNRSSGGCNVGKKSLTNYRLSLSKGKFMSLIFPKATACCTCRTCLINESCFDYHNQSNLFHHLKKFILIFICNWIQILERTCEVHFHYALYFYDVLTRGVLATEDANLARFAAYKSTQNELHETLAAAAVAQVNRRGGMPPATSMAVVVCNFGAARP